MKKCTKCKEEQSLDKFSYRENRKSYESECKKCVAKRANEYYWVNKKRLDEQRKKYYQDHREESLEKVKKHYEKNHDRIRDNVNEKRKTPEEREKIRIAGLKWRKENREKVSKRTSKWKKDNPLKSKAHQCVMWALRLNVLQRPEECQGCKRKLKVEGHHNDYSKPLEVEWLCRLCHMHKHDKLLYIEVKNDNSTGRQFVGGDKEKD